MNASTLGELLIKKNNFSGTSPNYLCSEVTCTKFFGERNALDVKCSSRMQVAASLWSVPSASISSAGGVKTSFTLSTTSTRLGIVL